MIHILFVILGLALLYFGSNFLVEGSAKLAKVLGIEPIIIGMTIVAFGTSLPEFVVSFLDSLSLDTAKSGIGLGNIIGSNIANIALVLGVAAVYKPIEIKKDTFRRKLPLVLAISIISYLMMLDGVVGLFDGIILTILFLLFLGNLFFDYKKGKGELAEEIDEIAHIEADKNYLKDIIYIIIGVVGLYFGARFVIDHGREFAKMLGVSDLVIGLTIVAVGTSLPELAATLQSLRKGEHEIGVGNIVGSNIFNLLFVMGIISLIKPFFVDEISIKLYGPLMLGITILLFPLTYKNLKISRKGGAFLLLIYFGYNILSYTA